MHDENMLKSVRTEQRVNSGTQAAEGTLLNVYREVCAYPDSLVLDDTFFVSPESLN